MLFKSQIRFVEDFERKFLLHFKETIEKNSFIIKNYVIKKQLYDKGIDGNTKRLKGYTRTTIRYKISKGQPSDRTTLKDKGDFYASITIDAYFDRFELSSNVSHTKYLIKRYGQEILKPTVENMNEFMRVHFIPSLKNKYGKFTR